MAAVSFAVSRSHHNIHLVGEGRQLEMCISLPLPSSVLSIDLPNPQLLISFHSPLSPSFPLLFLSTGTLDPVEGFAFGQT